MKGTKRPHTHTHTHTSAVLQCRHYLGHSQSLRLETTTNYNLQRKGVSARTWKRKYPKNMRLTKHVSTRLEEMHTRVQKVDRLSKKDVAKHVDWWQTGGWGGGETRVLSALLNSRHAKYCLKFSTAKPSENALCLDSLWITEDTTTKIFTEIKFKLVPASYNNMNYIWESCMWKPPSLKKKTHPPIHGASSRTHALLPNPHSRSGTCWQHS